MDQASIPAGDFDSWLKDTREAIPNSKESDVPCGECEGCCRSSYFIHIRPEEKETLARVPKALRFPAPGLPKGHVVMGYNEKGECPMLKETGCSIYAHRPQTCRAYDCRVFAATGTSAGGDEAEIINERVERWAFDYEGDESRTLHRALKAITAYLIERRPELPRGVIPHNPTQLAVLAIRGYDIFKPLLEGEAQPTHDALVQALAQVDWRG